MSTYMYHEAIDQASAGNGLFFAILCALAIGRFVMQGDRAERILASVRPRMRRKRPIALSYIVLFSLELAIILAVNFFLTEAAFGDSASGLSFLVLTTSLGFGHVCSRILSQRWKELKETPPEQ